MKNVGTMSIGVRTGVIKEGDNLAEITVNSVLNACEELNLPLENKDIIAITEAVVSISMGNYCTVDDIVKDLQFKVKTRHLGIVYPILSRNRFAVLLSAFARAMDKITFVLSYPSDEVGNDILDKEKLNNSKIPLSNYVMLESEYTELFGDFKHIFTGVNMVDFYRDICKKENCEVEFVFSNDPEVILDYTKDVLCADIHTRNTTKEKILAKEKVNVLTLADILNKSVDGSGYNSKYGLLGSNRATEEKVKLFPENGSTFVNKVKDLFKEKANKDVEVMIYGDGAFKDPVGKIWELADPVVSPAYTEGLEGSPNEIKLKYLSDNKFSNLKGEELNDAIKTEIRKKESELKGSMVSQGTTPRRYTDLIGSLCDLTSGSGDKGTPVILIKNYFKNYSN
ncbi:MAG TPA: F420-0--gamma-glutamyl ligase [Firmicutes bacterium]|nr:F420-0--gamma-glutamyl ligase [Bacillota bacterium]